MCRACAESEQAALLCQERVPDYLQQLPLFRELGTSDVLSLSLASRTRQLEDGQWLFRRGEEADRFFVVRQGQIALFRQSAHGKESIVAVVGANEVFGEEHILMDEATRDVNARAVGPCTLLSIEPSLLGELVGRCPKLARSLLRIAHKRQRMLLDHIERLSLQDAGGRLVNFLLTEVGGGKGSQRIRLNLPKHALAAHLAIQPETLSRVFSRLKEQGLLKEDEAGLVVESDRLRSKVCCDQCERTFWGCPGPYEPAAEPLRPHGRSLPAQ